MKIASLYLMIALYVVAGVNHFINPQFYIRIMPSWMPFHKEAVFVSGVCEILFALLLVFSNTRVLGAWCLIILLIAIFPANIQMMIDYSHGNNPRLWIAIMRLPVQALLIWWAYFFTKQVKIGIRA